MNIRELKIFARSLVRDQQFIDSHFLRWANLAYREFGRDRLIPSLHVGNSVALTPVAGTTQRFYLPYDYVRSIAFFDANGRSLDILSNEDVRQYGEYNTFGSFVAFYEYNGINTTTLADSGATPITIGIANRGTVVTASAAVFLSTHVGEWLLPLDRNTAAGTGNPEDYAYQIASFTDTTHVNLTLPFRGVLADNGSVGDLVTSYFQVRPINQKIIRIWGDPGASATINCEYQRVPSKLANNEDVPEEPRLAEAIVFRAIMLAGWAYREAFMVKTGQEKIMEALSGFETAKDFDKRTIRNFIIGNPNMRSYSQLSGLHLGQRDRYQATGVRY